MKTKFKLNLHAYLCYMDDSKDCLFQKDGICQYFSYIKNKEIKLEKELYYTDYGYARCEECLKLKEKQLKKQNDKNLSTLSGY
jgi:hypothetical protein